MIKRLALIALILYSLPGAAAKLQITDAWIKNLPPVVPARAGYMTITNDQAQVIRIVRLASESFARIEVHRSIMNNGVMSMRAVKSFAIEPGETRQLSPGGYHLMMMKPLKKLAPGNKILVTINFDDDSTQNIEMIVRK